MTQTLVVSMLSVHREGGKHPVGVSWAILVTPLKNADQSVSPIPSVPMTKLVSTKSVKILVRDYVD